MQFLNTVTNKKWRRCNFNRVSRSRSLPREVATDSSHWWFGLHQRKLRSSKHINFLISWREPSHVIITVTLLLCVSQGPQSAEHFIAAQCPLEHTRKDFWRMVWETGATTIVMLCSSAEEGKVWKEALSVCLMSWARPLFQRTFMSNRHLSKAVLPKLGRTLHKHKGNLIFKGGADADDCRSLGPNFSIKFFMSFFSMIPCYLEACLNQGIGVLSFLAETKFTF